MTSAYDNKELSVHEGNPIECFEFVGSYRTYRYTSGDVPITVGGNLYSPIAMRRSAVRAGTHNEDNVQVQLELPITAEVAKDYGFQVTPPALDLTIYRVHRDTDLAVDAVIYWKGPVTSITVGNDIATIVVPSAFSAALSGNVPSVYYQAPCNRVLFSTGCGVSRAMNSVTAIVVNISGNVIQLSTNGGFPDNWFVGGEIADTAHNDRRMVIAHAADQVTVNYPFSKLAVGTEVQVTSGCDHAFNGDCGTKYDNQINFGGFPFIPSVNPFVEGL